MCLILVIFDEYENFLTTKISRITVVYRIRSNIGAVKIIPVQKGASIWNENIHEAVKGRLNWGGA